MTPTFESAWVLVAPCIVCLGWVVYNVVRIVIEVLADE